MEQSADSSKTVSILIVDDDRVTREMTGLMVSRKFPNNTVYIANGGKTGLEQFKKHTPGLVITDIQMPEMDGMEMADAIKKINPDTRFIVLTAYGNTYFNEMFGKIGSNDLLSKPIEFDRLFALIEKIILQD